MRYRICRNAAPHQSDWWTVEYEYHPRVFGRLFGAKTKWFTVQEWDGMITLHGLSTQDRRFDDADEAQSWIDEAKRERVHQCGEPQ